MKNILVVFVALLLVACCQRSEAWFQGGRQQVVNHYPKKGSECEFKAQVAKQMVSDFQSNDTEMYENLDTYYNFGKVSAMETAIIITIAPHYERWWGTPSAAYRESLLACRAGNL